MKKAFLALLLLVGAAATMANMAFAQDEGIMKPSYQLLRQSLAAKSQDLRTSVASDSQFVGHSHTNHYSATNPWNIYVGTSRPNTATATNALWDFDDQTGLGTQDSLQGWWPVHMPYRYRVISTMTDDQAPWYCIDTGNQVNYRPIQSGRTFGVTGVWHADPGNAAGRLVGWAPLNGSKSMWCGLRALNDNTVIDPITHQPYNEQASQFNIWGASTAAAPIYRNYPGYGNAWDQILYRDFTATSGQGMTVSFLYRTRMSTSISTSLTGRVGWFHGDPLALTSGNFISSNAAGANAPRDSFSVYIGVPVNDNSVTYSDPTVSGSPVFDKQRRWFDEVIRIFDSGDPYFELLGVAGSVPADTAGATASYSATIPWTVSDASQPNVSAIYNATDNAAHIVRLVFRVKTTRSYSDDDYKSGSGVLNGGFTSYGRGAAIIDDVQVDGTLFDFEGTNGGVDNSIATAPTAAWKSTGKPTSQYWHPVNVQTATWNDVCGQPMTGGATCDLAGIVLSIGNADQSGSIGDSRFPTETEFIGGAVSPSIDLVTPVSGANEQGITAAITPASDDYYVQYEMNCAAFVLGNTGTLWNFGCQAYPALTANGHYAWSDLTGSPFRFYMSYASCFSDLESLKGNSMLHTSNANGIPDSLRLYLGMTSETYYFGGNPNSTDGAYFDDISLIIANKAAPDPVGPIASDIWQFFNDAFPVNGYATDNVAPGTANFDTTTALVKGAINISSSTGDANRVDILQDSVTVSAPNGTGGDPTMRADLVFRILPGPGNYQIASGRTFPPTSSMKLLKVPTNQAGLVSAGDNSFWGQYIATPGAFSSASAHHGGTWWDYLSWNSARCDTIETNIFPVTGKASSGVDAMGSTYQTTYHESDPHYEALGILKGRCFLIDPTGSATSANISCDTTFTKVAGNLVGDYELAATSGFDGRFSTKEYTKIIPDGLLTPGSHVQYFFRKQRNDGTGSFVMDPDTTNISPQLSESNYDGHRWQQFGVLPDRWKDTPFGGAGMACMLYVDNNDRRGDERIWVSVMDSIGGTAPAKYGAHNGWHATGAGFGLYNGTNANIAQAFVNKNQQPGTLWDMYGVKASESAQTGGTHIGNRYAVQPTGYQTDKGAAIGPKKSWLRAYYRWISWLTGDGNLDNFGPLPNIGQDDIGLMEDFLATPGGTAMPRALFVQGDGFAEQCNSEGGVQLAFLNDYLFTGLRDISYTDLTPALVSCPDLTSSSTIVPAGTVYGLYNGCTSSNDVLNTPVPTTDDPGIQYVTKYQASGANAPYYAGIEHLASTAHNWHSLINGWDMYNTFSRYCATSNGRLSYYYNLMVNAFGSVCSGWAPASATNDVPNNQGRQFVNFMKVGNSVMRSSNANIAFGVENGGRVRVRLYDVTGRVVRTLIDRTYEAGNHSATWDGRDDAGNQVARGVYFARIEFAKGAAINGRVVVLR